MSDDIDIGVLAESFGEFLSAEWPREKAVEHAKSPSPLAADLWKQAGALGWTALTAGEAQGGLGLGMPAAAALHEALGAAAAPLPMLGTTLATALIAVAGTQEQSDALIPGLADGSMRAAIASPDAATIAADGASLNGVVADILDAPAATLLLLPVVAAAQGQHVVPKRRDLLYASLPPQLLPLSPLVFVFVFVFVFFFFFIFFIFFFVVIIGVVVVIVAFVVVAVVEAVVGAAAAAASA